jgi:hypothetical protein
MTQKEAVRLLWRTHCRLPGSWRQYTPELTFIRVQVALHAVDCFIRDQRKLPAVLHCRGSASSSNAGYVPVCAVGEQLLPEYSE